ncbi:hypothetical protein LMJF_08_0640 [Leishmania major strain Friedlin]|uniref:Amastin-like protein n=1 Tax=Leishmania major TaxID=5664 RepID=Q4QIA5_LEIMA|nr:hypothetical protein LMJF_08_0640 [Leishmania major strain Friedlin]CAG9569361.1 Amastin_surface_glycoprotein_-_putative [Leishmania major strain Friedlin]CAJ02243.1 hypothetical protein LMJF_08_0640 [Leishmania major strain Friedlin]|eukprot:XP_001681093.1 hypothetical protein LMJF_08_0640 [Leishmania major strain Friedlin]
MASGSTHLALLRSGVVLSAVAAALCLCATAGLPIFRLNVDVLNSSITQSLWTTDMYTPAGEKHIAVKTFVKDCSDLALAFQVAQVSTLVGIGALVLAFVCSGFHMLSTFTRSSYRVRAVCGAPICLLLTVAIAAAGLNCYIMHAMYENNWCEKNATVCMEATEPAMGFVVKPSILLAPKTLLREVSTAHRSLTPSVNMKIALSREADILAIPLVKATATGSTGGLFGDCNPFDGCISSFRKMGFTGAEGWQTAWAALASAVAGFFAETLVVIIGSRRTSEAGLGESAVALLQGEDERLL